MKRGVIKWNYKTDENILLIQKKVWFFWLTIHRYSRKREADFNAIIDWWQFAEPAIEFIER